MPGREGVEITTKVIPLADLVPRFVEPGEDVQIRRMKLYRCDVRNYGAQVGCPGCDAALRGDQPRNHTETRRTRLEKEIETREKDRFAKETERMNERLAESISTHDRSPCTEAREKIFRIDPNPSSSSGLNRDPGTVIAENPDTGASDMGPTGDPNRSAGQSADMETKNSRPL